MKKEYACPVCDADLPLAGDEKDGEEVFCSSCGAPCTMRGNFNDDDTEVEEDF